MGHEFQRFGYHRSRRIVGDVVQPVGELDVEAVAAHPDKFFLVVGELADPHDLLLVIGEFEHEARHQLAEFLDDFFEGELRVFDGVVKDGSADEKNEVLAVFVSHQDEGYRNRMVVVRIATSPADLTLMVLIGKTDRLEHQGDVSDNDARGHSCSFRCE